MRRITMALAGLMVAGAMAATVPASAAEYEVQMLNKGTDGPMAFEPPLVKVAPGDTVHFRAVDKGHNVLSIEGMIPSGAMPFSGKMNEDVTVTLDQRGIYGFECKPHYGMGMVGMIVVGDPVNLAEAKAVPQKGKAKKKFEHLFQTMEP